MTLLDDLTTGVNNAQNFINNNKPLDQAQASNFKSDGFLVPAAYSADGTGLPSSKVPDYKEAQFKRNIITWFIPEFGVVRMYVNPQSISYVDRKLITKDRTKGGYSLQYWGEDLTTINMAGTTGSSGIEGINVLHEIYRAEQFAFDGTGLTLAANNASADIANNLINGAGGAIGQGINSLLGGTNSQVAAASGAGLLGGVLGLDSPNNTLSAKNIPSLAQLAFTVEMYYAGWIYRGFFENMTVNERADSFMLDYQITFVATQRRGYRVNRFGWERSPNQPSEYASPNSFSGNIISR